LQNAGKTETEHSFNYKDIGLKVGLEVHQQLATRTKLFCGCKPFSGEGTSSVEEGEEFARLYPIQLQRILRPSTSELGELDQAARFESRHEISVRYFANAKSSCLVEADEEPPHPISDEAVDTALIFSLALGSRVANEIHVMRKIVVDGSNTSGFQRTAVVALGGELTYNDGKSKVAVQSIGVEEDAARAVKSQTDEGTSTSIRQIAREYALDRLGTPLVEVALAPIEEGSPEDVENAASALGRLMRSTGRIARGLGTIRQDLNISVMGGSVIEVKGVQRLEQISKVVRYEASRQKFFYDLGKMVASKLGELSITTVDVTHLFKETQSKVLATALRHSHSPKVNAIVVQGFSGFIGKENEFGARLGKELGAIARAYGIGGVFHSDELPNYGITSEVVNEVRKESGIKQSDAFVLVGGESSKVGNCTEALIERLSQVIHGVPAETRASTEEGETSFLRPRPGAARMYPETDIPLIPVQSSRLEKLKVLIPEPWEKVVQRFSKDYDLPIQLSEHMLDSDKKDLFVAVTKSTKLGSRYVASALLDTLQSISREGVDVNSISDDTLKSAFNELDSGKFAKEAMPELIRLLGKNPGLSVDRAISEAGLVSMPREELEKVVSDVIGQNDAMIRQKGPASQSAIMGKVMQIVRGKVDGKLVNEVVSKKLEQHLKRISN
jgi:glutamyl-tRNA(Gln) amidotransferase subunit E